MPGKRSKKFIDKKNAVTFHLVHRSQRDPLQANPEASEHVFLHVPESETSSIKKEEQLKYGIDYDDDYDYMQHLRDLNELSEVEPTETFRVAVKKPQKPQEPQIKLPASVFGTDYETEVGLLNKAAPLIGPQLDWDPDIVAGLDDDFDFDNPNNCLDDDFVVKANAEEDNVLTDEKNIISNSDQISDNDEDFASDEAENDYDDNLSDVGSLGEQSFMSAETKTRFTNYSISSSVMRRNEGLTLLDDRFEKLYEEYDDGEIGALDHEEISGFVQDNSTLLNSMLDEFEEQQKKTKLKEMQKGDDANIVVSDTESSSTEDEMIEVSKPEQDFDCESILSTYSTLYNHPRLISEKKLASPIKLTKRAVIPSDVLSQKGPTLKQQEREAYQTEKGDRANTYRSKTETTEERKQRKQAIKEERKARREEKKINKLTFKAEELKQNREVLNVKKNFQGMQIV